MLEAMIVPKRKMNELRQLSFNLGTAALPDELSDKYTQNDLLNEAKDALKKAARAGKDKTVAAER